MTTAQQDSATSIKAYNHMDEFSTLLTDGENFWDISHAQVFSSTIKLMTELARVTGASEWPISPEPRDKCFQDLENGRLKLIAELQNPGQESESISLPTTDRARIGSGSFMTNPVPRNHRNWKHLVVWLDKLVDLRENLRKPGQAFNGPAQDPTGSDTPWGKILKSQPVTDGAWQVETEENRSGLMLSPELWDLMPHEVQRLMEHPRFAMEEKQISIVTVILGLDDTKTFNLAVNVAKRYYDYQPVLPYLMDTVPQVHYHVSGFNKAHRKAHRKENLGTFKTHLESLAISRDPEYLQEYENLIASQCCGEACDWGRCPP